MKATAQQQETLLELSQIDMRIRRAHLEIEKVSSADEIEAVRTELLATGESLRVARNLLDELGLDLRRAEQDLELVEQRIRKDNERLKQSSNPKDVQGIQHELISLAKRQSTLEDAELALIEKVEAQQIQVEEIMQQRESLTAKMASLEAEAASATAKLKSGLALLNQDRQRAKEHVGAELAEHYEKLATKGLSAGRLTGSACPVCGLLLSGSNLDEIRATSSDELAYCPECGGLLIRS